MEIRRDLAARNPDAFRPDLANALNNLGNTLDAVGRREEALAATEEAVRTLSPQFIALPAGYAQWMATMVGNYVKRVKEADGELDEDLLRPIMEAFESPKEDDSGGDGAAPD